MTPAVFVEPSRDLPICQKGDVLVCGSGPAGVAAAITAARAGAKTVLIEMHGCLGGVWTAGLLSYVLDTENKRGLLPELIARLETLTDSKLWRDPTPYPWARNCFTYDAEVMKLVLDQLCVEAGVRVRLYTRVVAAGKDENNRLSVVVTESKSGREAWAGKQFIDATGDGDLAALAGCGFDYGRPGDGRGQPMTLMALVGGLRRNEVAEFCLEAKGGNKKFHEAIEAGGTKPSYASPHLFFIREGLFAIMCNHIYGACGTNADDLTRATMQARAETYAVVQSLRKAGGVWSGIELISTGAQIGVREGRRIHGKYQITAQDLIEGKRHDDAVCEVTFPVDVHSPDANEGKGFGNAGVRSQPYDIPLRALIAKDVDGLLLAGRCISGDFFAHASYRVTGNAVAMGEAAGAEAARLASQ
jgi:hypothetical protein